MAKITKRFIAGAVCPQCGEMDALVMYKENNDDFRECVECGYLDKMLFTSANKELTTRVNKTEEEIKNETQVIKIL